ncbi:hypothetical protein SCHPADRAFT_930934 [Schizopora paradoxa]|uniref:Uncharacterized protein n=1 Tax=Schizopora paradoxa TaxID=27342 RepID=A0A0H2RE39_9AGAM|nr:hypothetical protein SCHPADRAFT_930934 [Schizopora paradoxa]
MSLDGPAWKMEERRKVNWRQAESWRWERRPIVDRGAKTRVRTIVCPRPKAKSKPPPSSSSFIFSPSPLCGHLSSSRGRLSDDFSSGFQKGRSKRMATTSTTSSVPQERKARTEGTFAFLTLFISFEWAEIREEEVVVVDERQEERRVVGVRRQTATFHDDRDDDNTPTHCKDEKKYGIL